MGRSKRKYPKNVYVYRGQLVYWPYLGCFNGKPKRGKRIPLGEPDMPEWAIFKALSEIQEAKEKTLEWLLSGYMESPAFKKLGCETKNQRKNIYYSRIVNSVSKRTGNRLGDITLDMVTPSMLIRFFDTIEGNPTRNKIKSFISAAWKWGILEDDTVPRLNPTKDVPKFEEVSRDFYVTDELYRKVRRTFPPFYRAAMEIAYQCRAREIEIFSITEDDLLTEGIYIKRTKGSIPEITLWNRRLRAAVKMIRKVCSNPNSKYLFHEKDGSKINPRSFSRRFKDCMARRVNSGKIAPDERFPFHDMKAKGVSDHEGNYSGHKTEKGKKIYIRKAPKVKGSR